MARRKKTVAVIFGGQSGEHEVSCWSALTIIRNINAKKYELFLIGITKEGKWLYVDDASQIEDGSWTKSDISAELSPDATKRCVIVTDPYGTVEDVFIDVCFPVLHGKYGEDGTIQGLFELSGIPYVGCGVLASAIGMDKFYTKIIADSIGIRQARFVGLRELEFKKSEAAMEKALDLVEKEIPYPVFVKPSKSGSSCGVTKAGNRKALKKAILLAFEIDSKVLCEEFIDGREVECSVLGGGKYKTVAAGVGEVHAAAEFYDYDAKYKNPDSVTDTHPDMPEKTRKEIMKKACRIFDAIDGFGLSRVDFFINKKGEVIFNEINTLPGFTGISMYPMLWEAAGLSKPALVDKLITMAFHR